jgi:hypothetical protein
VRKSAAVLVQQPKKELEVMETAVWIAIVATIGLLVTVGGVLVAITRRMTNTESAAATALQRADTAAVAVKANADKVEKVASELAVHREDVAKEYVSYRHMQSLETRLIDAVTQLGNRIDALFSRVIPHA